MCPQDLGLFRSDEPLKITRLISSLWCDDPNRSQFPSSSKSEKQEELVCEKSKFNVRPHRLQSPLSDTTPRITRFKRADGMLKGRIHARENAVIAVCPGERETPGPSYF